MRTAMIESAIRMELDRNGSCALDTLIERLPQCSWNEVFAVIDQLSREGTLVLHRTGGCDYHVSACQIPGPCREQRDAVREEVLR